MTDSNCQVCQVNTGKYSCPRCNIFYCSLNCYRSQSHLECSEAFYEKCVKEELKNQSVESEATRKMYEILKGIQQQSDSEDNIVDSDDDSESEPDLAVRVADLNLNDPDIVWDRLTSQEKKEFKKLVSNGEILKIVPAWEPWWIAKKKKILIQETGEAEFSSEESCPLIRRDIPELSALTKVPPSPHVSNMLVNILGAYVSTLRWLKGTHLEMAVEAISTCLTLSATLRTNSVFSSAVEAFIALEDDYLKCDWVKNVAFNGDQIYEDLMDIAQGQHKNDPFFGIKAALSDLDLITSKACDILGDSRVIQVKRFTRSAPTLKQLILIKKKVTYYLSWTTQYGSLFVNAMSHFRSS